MRAAVLIVTLALLATAPVALADTDAPAAAETAAQTELVLSEATASEPAEAPATPEEQTAEEQAPAAQVCRSPERSESRLRSRRERVCRTQAEWDAIDRAQQRARSGGSH